MKKLMIAAAIVCIAAASQAALFKWSTADALAGNLYDGTTTKAAANTLCYLFDVTTLSQEDAFKAFKGGTLSAKLDDAVENTKLNSSSRISAKEVTYGTTGANSTLYWIALIGDDKIYISNTKTDSPVDVGGTPITWDDVRTTSNNGVKTAFAGAGVYGSAVPEPTSGLLLILGMAGLALRRRRA